MKLMGERKSGKADRERVGFGPQLRLRWAGKPAEPWALTELREVTRRTPVKRNSRRAPMRAQAHFDPCCPLAANRSMVKAFGPGVFKQIESFVTDKVSLV